VKGAESFDGCLGNSVRHCTPLVVKNFTTIVSRSRMIVKKGKVMACLDFCLTKFIIKILFFLVEHCISGFVMLYYI
jgi:hypothetical protein